jgi:hypothetical protein
MRRLLPRLPAVLTAKEATKDPAESCEFARLGAQAFQQREAAPQERLPLPQVEP